MPGWELQSLQVQVFAGMRPGRVMNKGSSSQGSYALPDGRTKLWDEQGCAMFVPFGDVHWQPHPAVWPLQ